MFLHHFQFCTSLWRCDLMRVTSSVFPRHETSVRTSPWRWDMASEKGHLINLIFLSPSCFNQVCEEEIRNLKDIFQHCFSSVQTHEDEICMTSCLPGSGYFNYLIVSTSCQHVCDCNMEFERGDFRYLSALFHFCTSPWRWVMTSEKGHFIHLPSSIISLHLLQA